MMESHDGARYWGRWEDELILNLERRMDWMVREACWEDQRRWDGTNSPWDLRSRVADLLV